jgi:putative SOS response-associated peptidase YedK
VLQVADGFYEWKREEKEKTPHYFVREDKKPIFFAGIYENDQFCLITEEASDNIKEIHHRQPGDIKSNRMLIDI